MDTSYSPHGKSLTLLQIKDAADKRIALITKEFTNGFDFIKNYPRSVTFFGSARTSEGDEYYEKARSLAKHIVERLHYSIVTGGGPGVMQAANRGAYEAGGNSIGLTIELPHEQQTNIYLTDKLGFHYFFIRKVCLAFSAEAYVFLPGGFGTLDEFTEILTLMQTNKVPKAPIILVGEAYWRPLDTFFKDILLVQHNIDPTDTSLYTITDDSEKIISIIEKAPVRLWPEYDEKSDGPSKENTLRTEGGPISMLSKKRCIPCEEGTEPMSREESEKMLEKVDQWVLFDDKEIRKTYQFKDFSSAIDFMNNVARIAEIEGHHPDLKLHDYKKVDVEISTHAIGGLSENDFILAAKIDELLRK